ncbi:alpha/beta-hydrolase [Trametes gibbosa]|nr:alpha/beta-hydrolase [Trametes gibbosa]
MAYSATTVQPLLPARRATGGLKLVAKRYVPHDSHDHDGYTLLLFHCAGSHKEVWEPTIEAMLSTTPTSSRLPIREIWSFDMQNHGQAATANAAARARAQPDSPLNVDDWAEGVRAFVASGPLATHKLVGIGHSLGASAMILATIGDRLCAPVRFEAVVLVEDALMAWATYASAKAENDLILTMIADAIKRRRDTWPSRDAALAYFQQRFQWEGWHPRVLELYVRMGLREVAADKADKDGPGQAVRQVTLACSKDEEAHAYHHIAPHFRVGERLRALDGTLPIHFVHGERFDVLPEHMHLSVLNTLKRVTSVQQIADAGHFVVQENPTGLAAALARIVASLGGGGGGGGPRASL